MTGGGNQKRNSIPGKKVGSSSTFVTMLGIIIATIIVLSCIEKYRYHPAPLQLSATPIPINLKIIDKGAKQTSVEITKKKSVNLELISNSELIKKLEKLHVEEKKDAFVKEEEISDENMEIEEKEKETKKLNLRKEKKKTFKRNEDRKYCTSYSYVCIEHPLSNLFFIEIYLYAYICYYIFVFM